MSQSPPPGLGDLFALLGTANPFAGMTRTIAQFQIGVEQFLLTVENFNDTMQQLNGVAARVNGLLDTVEEPIAALVPQMTRTIKAADVLVSQLSGSVEKVAPGLSRLADTLSAPALKNLPTDLGDFLDVLSELGRRLQPLTQMAESAGSLFGFRPLAALRPRSEPAAPAVPATPTPKKTPASKKAAAKKASPAKAATANKKSARPTKKK
jgi:ABC-type transporter Mla subunit MlaD